MPVRNSALSIALLSVVVSGASGQENQQVLQVQSPQQAPAEKTQVAADSRRMPPVAVSAEGNLSVAVSRARLGALLHEISALTEVPIVVAEGLENDLISLKMRDVSVDEGLKRLLAAYDAFFLFSAEDNKTPGSIRSVWVYARGQGRDLEPVPSSMWASSKELERQLEDPNADVRGQALEALIERQGERGLDTVKRGLSDPDETVRLRTLGAAIDADVDIPAADLEALVLDAHAQSQSIRVLALQALQPKPEAEAIALTLRNDPDDVVREQARRILESVKRPPL